MSANRAITDKPKRKAPKSAWKPGQSGNPNGRPKDGASWASIIKTVGDMYPTDILLFVGTENDLGRMLKDLPPNVQMKYLVTARIFSALMFEPTSGLWKELMERVEGKVQDRLDLSNTDGTFSNESAIYDRIMAKIQKRLEGNDALKTTVTSAKSK